MLEWRNSDGLPVLNLSDFVSRFAEVLPKLLDCMAGSELRAHPVWQRWLPYDAEPYGVGRSLGHCVRPNVILTPEGPKICEIDCVPSGRGYGLSAIPDRERRHEYLGAFARWYQAMDAQRVVYATAATTVCFEESDAFATALREECGVDIRAVNIDETPLDGELIDRLCYRVEMADPRRLVGKEVVTKEPHLDSKLVAAVIHDRTPAMEEILLSYLTLDELDFLREVFPPTYLLPLLRANPAPLAQMVENAKVDGKVVPRRYGWVIKNGDVETAACWGSRGVIMGRKYGERAFRDAVVQGVNPNHKDMGARPVLQRFVPSLDFKPVWDAMVAGELTVGNRMGRDAHPITRQTAERHVTARVGFFCLVANTTSQVFVPPVGVLTLRQDELAHGSSDALFGAFEIA